MVCLLFTQVSLLLTQFSLLFTLVSLTSVPISLQSKFRLAYSVSLILVMVTRYIFKKSFSGSQLLGGVLVMRLGRDPNDPGAILVHAF